MKDLKNRRLNSHGNKYYYLSFFITIISFLGHSAVAQNYFFKHYSIENGLTQSQVVDIYQDYQSYLWLATLGGVSRFNGIDFTNYTKMDGLSDDLVTSISQENSEILLRTNTGISSIRDGKIKTIFKTAGNYWAAFRGLLKDKNGQIWFIDASHLNRLYGSRSASVPVTSSKDERILALAQNRQGKLFVIVYGKGVYCEDGNSWVNVLPFKGICRKEIFIKFFFDKFNANKMYLLTSRKLYVANDTTMSQYKNKIIDTRKNILFTAAQDRQGVLWLATEEGVYYLRDKDPIRFNAANGFTDVIVQVIYEDPQGGIWLGTDGDGFYKFDGFDVTGINRVNSNPVQLVMSIGVDKSGNLWMGTNGQGLVKYDGNKLENIKLPSPEPLSGYIPSMAYKNGQPLLFGSLDGLWQFDHGKFNNISKKYGLPRAANMVIYDQFNTIWMISYRGCFYLDKNNQTGIIQNVKEQLQTIIEIGRDSILLGHTHGIILVKNRSVDTSFKFNALASLSVTSLIRFKDLIIGGTQSEGMFSIDLRNKKVVKYTAKQGLISNSIYSLIADQYGTVWAGTGKGINRFVIDPHTQALKMINNLGDNPIIEFDANAIVNYNNKIWAGSTNGLYIYNSKPSSDVSRLKPVLNIESVKIFDQNTIQNRNYDNYSEAQIPAGINFSYGNKHLAITFRGIFYNAPESLMYQYRLKGLDQQFSVASKLNTVNYTALPPGNYEFQVKAVTANGTLSDIKTLAIVITPAFYQTSFFYVLLFILLLSFIIFIQWILVQRKTRQRLVVESIKYEEQVKIRRQTAEDFHDDIGNKLTRIVVLTDILDRKFPDKNKEHKALIDEIRMSAANLYSGAKDILWALDPQSDDLHEVLLRIKNFAIDLFSNTDIDVEFLGFDVYYNKPLPLAFNRNFSMILKELLNNVLKHSSASKVTLSAFSNKNKVEIILEDNGKGFDKSLKKQGRGLANIKLRAERIRVDLYIYSQLHKGTKTVLEFDLETLK